MKSLRLAALALVTVALAACSDLPTTPNSPTFAKGGGTGGGGTPAPAPAPNLAGHWVESPKRHAAIPGGFQEVWYEFDAIQSGKTLSGTVRRYVSYFDANDVQYIFRRDLGAPGKLSGSINGTAVNIGFLKITEAKLNIGYVTTLSTDLTTLTVNTPTAFGAQGFVRQ
jgi:hypothetical protein